MTAATEEHSFNRPVLSTKRFNDFSNFIMDTRGIKMPDSKRSMLQSRLQKRLRHLKLKTFDDYYHYVFNGEGREKELQHLLDVVTTHKTDFFREPRH